MHPRLTNAHVLMLLNKHMYIYTHTQLLQELSQVCIA